MDVETKSASEKYIPSSDVAVMGRGALVSSGVPVRGGGREEDSLNLEHRNFLCVSCLSRWWIETRFCLFWLSRISSSQSRGPGRVTNMALCFRHIPTQDSMLLWDYLGRIWTNRAGTLCIRGVDTHLKSDIWWHYLLFGFLLLGGKKWACLFLRMWWTVETELEWMVPTPSPFLRALL